MALTKTGLLVAALLYTVVAPIATTLQGQELKSMHTVSIEARNVAWELRVNDIPVLSNDDDASMKMSGYPISVWLITGRNTVSVRILKVEHSTTDPMDPKYCKVVVSGPKGEATTAPVLAQVEAKPAPKSGADLSSSREASFSATLKHPNPAWATSAKIGKDAATQQLILDKFREFHGLLTKKDLNGVMQFSAAKFKEYEQALGDPTFGASQKTSFQEQFASAGKLLGIDVQAKNGLRFEYYAGDRLISINNDENRSIIQYYDSSDGTTTQYVLYFYFDGKGFVLIR